MFPKHKYEGMWALDF